jgi:hypothetical protein
VDYTFSFSRLLVPSHQICSAFVVGTYTIGKLVLNFEVSMKTGKQVYLNNAQSESIM